MKNLKKIYAMTIFRIQDRVIADFPGVMNQPRIEGTVTGLLADFDTGAVVAQVKWDRPGIIVPVVGISNLARV